MRASDLTTLVALAYLALASSCGTFDDQGGPESPVVSDTGDGHLTALSAVVFDESVIRNVRLNLDSDAYQALNADPRLEEYEPGSVQYLGETYSDVGIRYKGGNGSLHYCFDSDGQRNDNCSKLSIKLKFNEYVKGARFYGMKRLNLHAMGTDGSQMRESFIYKLYRDAGVYAPRTSYIHLYVNDEDMGLYLALEQIDERFTRSRFEDGGRGNLYKNVWPSRSDERRFVENLKSNADAPDVSKLMRFSDSIQDKSSEHIHEQAKAWTDMEQLISYLAVTRLVEQWDGLLGWYCGGSGCRSYNFYLYESESEDKFTIIPWDYNNAIWYDHPMREAGAAPWTNPNPDCQTFSSVHGDVQAPSCDPLLGALSRHQWDAYVARSEELIRGDLSEQAVERRIDDLISLIRSEVEADPYHPGKWDAFHTKTLKQLAHEKRQRVIDDIAARN